MNKTCKSNTNQLSHFGIMEENNASISLEITCETAIFHLLTVVESKISTIVICGATESYMDDIEHAIDDGVNTYLQRYIFFDRKLPFACSLRNNFQFLKSTRVI